MVLMVVFCSSIMSTNNRRWGVSVCDDSADINGGGGSKNMETIILERSLFKVILTGHTSSITSLKSYRAL